jgi:drug/metabolite transporter (DMT)-like permease
MKRITWFGILLVVLGGLALAYQGFNYTRHRQVMDVGPMHVTTETQDRVSIPPWMGGLALLGGVVLLVVGARKNP